jgi:transposase InsO family protein
MLMATSTSATIEQTQIDLLVSIRERDGIIGRPAYEAALEAMGRVPSPGAIGNLRRKVNRIAPAPEVPSRSYEPSRQDLADLARSPSLRSYYDDHVTVEHPDLSFSSWYRALYRKVDPGLLAYIKPGPNGMEAFRKATLGVLWSCDNFGDAWQADVVTLPFLAVPPGRGYKHPVKVQAILILDDATRLIVGWKVVYCTQGRAVRASDVCDALIGAMDRWGVPDHLVVDNGKEFDNQRVSRCMKVAGAAVRTTVRYRAEAKGKIERLNGTLVRWLRMAWPTWTAGHESSARYTVSGGTTLGAPNAAAVHDFLSEMIDVRYNTQHHHRSLDGLTPLQARETDQVTLPRLALERVLRFGSVHNEKRKDEFVQVETSGVALDGHRFTNVDPDSPGRNNRPGSVALAAQLASRHRVRIRRINGDPTRIGVFTVDDDFVCIATRTDKIPTEARLAHSATAARDLLDAERLAIEAHEQLLAEQDLNITDGADDDELERRRRARTTLAAIADTLNTDPHHVYEESDGFNHGGKKISVRRFVVSDLGVRFNEKNVAAVIAAWVDREHLDVYRIDTAAQSVVYDQKTGFATIASKNKGDIDTQIRIVLNAA